MLATFKLHLCVGVRLQSSYLFIGKINWIFSCRYICTTASKQTTVAQRS